jgi:hypothetical protein
MALRAGGEHDEHSLVHLNRGEDKHASMYRGVTA